MARIIFSGRGYFVGFDAKVECSQAEHFLGIYCGGIQKPSLAPTRYVVRIHEREVFVIRGKFDVVTIGVNPVVGEEQVHLRLEITCLVRCIRCRVS